MMLNKQKRPVRFFNTTGPCNPWDHYMLPPADRIVGAQLHRYIRDNLYWVLHAPRQTGKTTFLQNWAREINAEGTAVACYISIEACQGITSVHDAMLTMHNVICEFARASSLPIPNIPDKEPQILLYETMRQWSQLIAPKPLSVLIDETDVLEGDVIISFLRQLRSGFSERGIGKFPISIALVGMRDLKDYIFQSKDGTRVNPGSPFNIKQDSATISNFSRENIGQLFSQRTEETGQKITDEALNFVWEQSNGQPWIVNSLFSRATMRVLHEDSIDTVEIDHVQKACEQMIQARETHLDALAYRMENPEVKKIIESLIVGNSDPLLNESSGFHLAMDLGLITLENGTPIVANPIYREILARQLTYGPQLAIVKPEWQWEKPDGTLDMDKLLKEFQIFWRENSEAWDERMNYTEAFPHLLLMAFLQRVLNGGGRIEREYSAGRGRMDLFVEYNTARYILELKLVHNKQSIEIVKSKGVEQTKTYRDTKAPQASAYLILFDRRDITKTLPWEERLYWEESDITVVGC